MGLGWASHLAPNTAAANCCGGVTRQGLSRIATTIEADSEGALELFLLSRRLKSKCAYTHSRATRKAADGGWAARLGGQGTLSFRPSWLESEALIQRCASSEAYFDSKSA